MVTAAFGLPVAQQGTWTVGVSGSVAVTGTFWQATQPISGTVTANAGTNLNTSTLALETGGNLASLNTKTPALGQALAAASSPVVLTAIQVAALTPLTTVAVTESGTWNIATVTTVTTVGAVTAITNALPAGTNSIGTVQPGNTPNTTPWLACPADPAVTTGNITVVDSAVVTTAGQSGQSILTVTPTANSSVTVALSGETCVNLQVAGTWTGTLVFERSIDGGTTYYPAGMLMHGNGGLLLSSITGNCGLRVNAGGSTNFRVRATAAVTGTAAITFRPGFGEGPVSASIETGGNVIGQIAASDETSTIYEGTTALTPLFAQLQSVGKRRHHDRRHPRRARKSGCCDIRSRSTAP